MSQQRGGKTPLFYACLPTGLVCNQSSANLTNAMPSDGLIPHAQFTGALNTSSLLCNNRFSDNPFLFPVGAIGCLVATGRDRQAFVVGDGRPPPGTQGGRRRVLGGVVLRGLPGGTVPGVLEQQGQQALHQRQSTQVTGSEDPRSGGRDS